MNTQLAEQQYIAVDIRKENNLYPVSNPTKDFNSEMSVKIVTMGCYIEKPKPVSINDVWMSKFIDGHDFEQEALY